jgi:hypothetical protein
MASPASGFEWRRAAQCSTEAGCVEVGFDDSGVVVRNSAEPDEQALLFTREEWAAFLAGVKAGEFDA